MPGFEARETGIGAATAGVASVQVARPVAHGDQGQVTSHAADILFTFVLEGSLTLCGDGQGAHALGEGGRSRETPGRTGNTPGDIGKSSMPGRDIFQADKTASTQSDLTRRRLP